MPSVPLIAVPTARDSQDPPNPLPQLLHTPSGLAMIELQGSVLSEDNAVGVSAALTLGRLVFPAADEQNEDGEWDGKRVFLFVGKHQKMTGEVKKLAKPLAMLRRSLATDDTNVENGDRVEIAEIVHYKILFAHRPEPMGAGQLLHQE